MAVIFDRYGSMAKESDDFLDLVANEAGSPGIRPSYGCSPADFRRNISGCGKLVMPTYCVSRLLARQAQPNS